MSRKLGTKQLDAMIATLYKDAAKGKMINIMDIGKVYTDARAVYAATSSLDDLKVAVDKAVSQYCTKCKGCGEYWPCSTNKNRGMYSGEENAKHGA
jgi:hypothetical protein